MGKDLNGNELPKGVMQLPNGTYRGRFKYQGEQFSLVNNNLKALLTEMDDLKYEIRHGLKGNGDSISLNEWFEVWLGTHKKNTIKESTYVRYNDLYNQYIRKKLGQKRLSNFKPIVLEQLFQQMAKDNYSTKTIHDVYNVLNAMFKYAIHNRIIIFNPCDGVGLPKTKTKDFRVLSVSEQTEVLEHAKGRLYEYLITIALGTGMRAGELFGLTWDDVDFKKREIRVSKTLVHIKDLETGKYHFKYQTPKTKNGFRTIPMQESVYHALRQQRIKLKEMQMAAKNWCPLSGFDNLVFLGTNGKPMTQHQFQVTLNWIEKSINKERLEYAAKTQTEYEPFSHFYPHALRHTFATRCFDAGIDAKVVQGYLGHYSIAITLDLYTHVSDDKARTEMGKLENLYQKII